MTQEILLVRGALSPVLSAETAARMVAAAPSASLVEVPDAGHLIPLEQPARLAVVLRDFLG